MNEDEYDEEEQGERDSTLQKIAHGDYIEIRKDYTYDDKLRHTSVLYFPDKSIATVTRTDEDEYGEISTEVVTYGMEVVDVEHYFPPRTQELLKDKTFNLALLLRSIIFEAFYKEGQSMESGNVRNFWYTHVKAIVTVLGIRNAESALNSAWDEMINSGLCNYEEMNIIGGKESTRSSVVKDSPFSNIIIALEKADYYDYMLWLPKLFNCTLITAGGQPARTVSRAFILKLKDLGVDLDQQFYMCVASDLDPAGYYIQEAFRKQLEGAIRAYGGKSRIEIKRLFVRKDQVSDQLLRTEAMPCYDKKATSETAKKSENTKWEFFREATGGLYVPKPNWWRDEGPVYDIDGEEMVRGLLEMNAFSKRIIEQSIIRELLKIIEATSDESKIMIPEIMRIFEIMRKVATEEVYAEWHEKLIKPLIDKFLEETGRWTEEIRRKRWNEEREAEQKQDEQFAPIDENFDALVEEENQKARDRVPELFEQQEDLEDRIAKLNQELEEVEDRIHEECEDIFDEIDRLEEEREEEKTPIKEEYEKEYKDIELRIEYRERKLREFQDEKITIFNPMEMALKSDIADVLELDEKQRKELNFFFRDIELIERFQPHISRLLENPELLTEEKTSCFEHPVPTFTEKDLLHKASQNRDENIESVRNAFPPAFTNEMKQFLIEHIADKEFELTREVEEEDLSEDVNRAMEETEEEIEEGNWRGGEEEE